MKATVPLLGGLALLLVSCAAFDPEYAEYKEQKKAQESAPSPYGSTPDPYGASASNPYGVPSSSAGGSEVGSYTPTNPPPYQPLPGVPNDPLPPTRVTPNTSYPSSYPTIPSPSTPSAPAPSVGPSTPYTVVKGDSLWGISRRHGTSVDAIKQANGLTSDTIQVGQTLQIPR